MSKQANTNLTLDVYPRTGSGKNAAFRTRAKNLIPAVVYGSKMSKDDKPTGLSVSLDPKNFLKVYQVTGRSSLVDVALQEGAPAELAGSKVLIKALQSNPLKREVLHVDILQLDMAKELRVVVPLKFVGKAKGLTEGGILSIMVRQVEIKCLPADIPHEIEVDVTGVNVNETIHIHQLSERMKDSKFEFIYDSDYTLCGVVPPEEEKAATPAEAAAADAAAAPAAGTPAAAAPAAAPAKDAKK
ncbi:MAG: 50S ribosomal protein L25 [Bdellovibrionota bacterium]